MQDGYGREIDYARISITDRCNLRCVYCMPESGVPKVNCSDILSYEDIVRVCGILAQQGIRKLKITGGEPLVRKDVASLIRQLKALPGIHHVSLTTNGVLLGAMARDLAAAGLDSVNISLDTLDPERYRAITRLGSVHAVLEGIERAGEADIASVKVNCVPIEGVNEEDIVALAELARLQDIHVRFIEMMPIGLGKGFRGMSPQKIREALEQAYGVLEPFRGRLGNGPAYYYSLAGFRGKIGFIGALSDCFCQACNRVRLTSDGMLKTCLHLDEGVNLLPLLNLNNDGLLRKHIVQAIWNKPARHRFEAEQSADAEPQADRRIMSQIGG